jgi:predicted kinase
MQSNSYLVLKLNRKFSIPKPLLIVLVGVAGSGKSTLANEIALKLDNSAFLSKDLIQSSFSSERVGGELYSLIRGPTFKALVTFADTQLSHGKTPIIDCPFSRNHTYDDKYRDWPLYFKKIAQKHKTELVIIRCKAPSEKELKKRIAKRNYSWDKPKLLNWTWWIEYEPQDFPIPSKDVHEVITNLKPSNLAEKVLKEIIKVN